MLFAETNDAVQFLTAFFALLGSAMTVVLIYLLSNLINGQKAAREAMLHSIAMTTVRLDSVVEKIEQVHRLTDGLKDQLSNLTTQEAIARSRAEK